VSILDFWAVSGGHAAMSRCELEALEMTWQLANNNETAQPMSKGAQLG
jgi:hypothetical protein